jgi:hypothetical protein
MRTVLYVLLFVGGGCCIAAGLQYALLLARAPLVVALLIGGYLPYALFAVGGYIWFRRGRVAAPASFTGLPLVASWVSLVLFLLAVAAYGVLVATGNGQGLSGVPFGMLLVLLAPVVAMAFAFVEFRDWTSFWNARRLAKVNGQTS